MTPIKDPTKKSKTVSNASNPIIYNFQLPPVPLNLTLPKNNIGANLSEHRP